MAFKKSIHLIEVQCPPGHINWIKSLLSELLEAGHQLKLSTYESYFRQLSPAPEVVFHSLGADAPSGPPLGRLTAMGLALRRALAQPHSQESTLLLSYHPFFLRAPFTNSAPLHAFEHNNLDRALESPVYKLMLRTTAAHVSRICFEPYIAEYVRSTMQRDATVHPFSARSIASNADRRSELIASLGEYIFAPTASTNVENLESLSHYARRRHLNVVIRHELPTARLRADATFIQVTPPLSAEYDSLFSAASTIAVLNNYSYRVSAVFYECIANRKPIVMANSLFARYCSAAYPGATLDILE